MESRSSREDLHHNHSTASGIVGSCVSQFARKSVSGDDLAFGKFRTGGPRHNTLAQLPQDNCLWFLHDQIGFYMKEAIEHPLCACQLPHPKLAARASRFLSQTHFTTISLLQLMQRGRKYLADRDSWMEAWESPAFFTSAVIDLLNTQVSLAVDKPGSPGILSLCYDGWRHANH